MRRPTLDEIAAQGSPSAAAPPPPTEEAELKAALEEAGFVPLRRPEQPEPSGRGRVLCSEDGCANEPLPPRPSETRPRRWRFCADHGGRA